MTHRIGLRRRDHSVEHAGEDAALGEPGTIGVMADTGTNALERHGIARLPFERGD